ncbi:hypothetical protein FB45DRAFT_1122058 [Roridomyces roridus]|uniref:Uncharacterized protein n=1 Tax=Roridomyces roridus TaxID=1738132 RepID=A0AAD7B563_9AGAR|nr:hypothetical protein FB45DRAFT_1122058 [Roridomyces roridus]
MLATSYAMRAKKSAAMTATSSSESAATMSQHVTLLPPPAATTDAHIDAAVDAIDANLVPPPPPLPLSLTPFAANSAAPAAAGSSLHHGEGRYEVVRTLIIIREPSRTTAADCRQGVTGGTFWGPVLKYLVLWKCNGARRGLKDKTVSSHEALPGTPGASAALLADLGVGRRRAGALHGSLSYYGPMERSLKPAREKSVILILFLARSPPPRLEPGRPLFPCLLTYSVALAGASSNGNDPCMV